MQWPAASLRLTRSMGVLGINRLLNCWAHRESGLILYSLVIFLTPPPPSNRNISRLEGALWYAHRLMKKTFPLHIPGKEDSKVVEAIKLELTKYVKRERRKTLPEGADFWDFSCKVGTDGLTATATPLPDVAKAVESVALTEAAEVYVEIMASPGHRVKRPAPPSYQRRDA